jgi:hypothetical protein
MEGAAQHLLERVTHLQQMCETWAKSFKDQRLTLRDIKTVNNVTYKDVLGSRVVQGILPALQDVKTYAHKAVELIAQVRQLLSLDGKGSLPDLLRGRYPVDVDGDIDDIFGRYSGLLQGEEGDNVTLAELTEDTPRLKEWHEYNEQTIQVRFVLILK